MVRLAPDPPREAVEEDFSTGEGGHNIVVNSDSDEEPNAHDGYELLSMGNDIPASDSDSDDSDDESIPELPSVTQPETLPSLNGFPSDLGSAHDLKVVWSAPREREGIVMDTAQVDQVKAAMASFKLPPSAIPPWAASVPEDQWREQLMDRLKTLQDDKPVK